MARTPGLAPALGGKRRALFVRLVANGALQAAAMAATAWFAQQAFDGWIMGASSTDAMAPEALAAALAVAAFVTAALRYHERVTAERLGQDFVGVMRLALFDRLGRLPPRTIQARSRGGHLLRFIGDLTALRQWLSLGLARLAVAAVALAVTMPLLWLISAPVAGAVCAVAGIGALVSLALGPRIRAAVSDSRQHRGRLAGNVDEKIAAIGTVQVFGQLKRERSRLERQSRRLRAAMVHRAHLVGLLRAVTEATAGLAVLAILVVGARAVARGEATPGSVIAGMTVLGMIVPMLRDLSRVHEYWHSFVVARGRIERFMCERTHGPALMRGRSRLADGPAEVALRDLGVGTVLTGITATARSGEVVALVGANGAGKSTLLGVIARLLDADAGEVLIDGIAIARCRLNSVRRAVGLVGPDLPLLRGTLERNLRYRCPDASDDEFMRTIRACGLEALIARLPGGLASRISDGGSNLSLGERQRVALARALLGRPRILLLDEVDAHLDAASASTLDRVLEAFPGTVLMATHDRDRAARADCVWHLEHGVLVACGPPAQLLAPGSATSRLLAGPCLKVVA